MSAGRPTEWTPNTGHDKRNLEPWMMVRLCNGHISPVLGSTPCGATILDKSERRIVICLQSEVDYREMTRGERAEAAMVKSAARLAAQDAEAE